jgi:hypothetical protein
VSIALTFGTAAVIDYNKKQKEKREIVMMVMYDMYNSLKSVEEADYNIRNFLAIQLSIAEDTTRFDSIKNQLAFAIPRLDYTETTERIFSSNIETISTVGNVLFTESVAGFYLNRRLYKSEVCDSIHNEIRKAVPLISIGNVLSIDYYFYGLASCCYLGDMRLQFAVCKQIMDVTDEEIEAYREEREKVKKSLPDIEKAKETVADEIQQLDKRLREALKKNQAVTE